MTSANISATTGVEFVHRGVYYREVIRNSEGEVIRRSKNLAGLRRHASKVGIKSLEVARNSDGSSGGVLRVKFANGDWCDTGFASYHVMCAHFLAGRRSWFSCPLKICGRPATHTLLGEAVRAAFWDAARDAIAKATA
jgi:hypothetical protein